MRGIDELARNLEGYGQAASSREIQRVIDAFYKNQQVWVDAQDRVAPTLGRRVPVGGGITAPGGIDARLIPQVHPNHVRLPDIAFDHCLPVADPARFGIAAVIPESI